MKSVLAYLDPEEVEPSLDLLGAADRMYGAGSYVAFGLTIGSDCPAAVGSVDHLLLLDPNEVQPYDVETIARCLSEEYGKYPFDAILFPVTIFSRMLAARLAMRLQAGLVAEVTGIRWRDSALLLVRPAFSGRLTAEVAVRGAGPIMMTIQRNAFTRSESKAKSTRIRTLKPQGGTCSAVRLTGSRARAADGDIRECDVLVACGGGMLRHLEQAEALASELKGMTAASRRVVDGGKASRDKQVGQSGRMVRPRLYIAIGISGAVQHIVGIQHADIIIAVNTDPHAPICALADVVVTGDGAAFATGLLELIRSSRERQVSTGARRKEAASPIIPVGAPDKGGKRV